MNVNLVTFEIINMQNHKAMQHYLQLRKCTPKPHINSEAFLSERGNPDLETSVLPHSMFCNIRQADTDERTYLRKRFYLHKPLYGVNKASLKGNSCFLDMETKIILK